jgi:hypothetical protein
MPLPKCLRAIDSHYVRRSSYLAKCPFLFADNIEKIRSNSMKPSFSPRYFEPDTMPEERFQSFNRRESSPAIVSITSAKRDCSPITNNELDCCFVLLFTNINAHLEYFH